MIPQLEVLSRRVGRFPIELPAAALTAVAVALVTMALPDWRFEGAVAASGLPAIVPAAQPPLGGTARLLVALLLAGVSFAIVWFGLRALDPKLANDDFPAFRAADLHPDAPRRRPILAGAEFGAPADDLPPIEMQIARKRTITEPLPSFLAPQPSEIGDFVPESADASEPQDADFEELEPEEVRDTEDSDPFFAPLAKELPAFLNSDAAAAEATGDPDDLASMMARLETGLVRTGSKPTPGPANAAREQVSRALGELDRASARGR